MTAAGAGHQPPAREQWRGTGRDAGLYLPPDLYARAAREHEIATQLRAAVDADVAAATRRLDPQYSGTQVGADHSLKGSESYLRKVAMADRRGARAEEAIGQTDLHRYTYTFPVEQYSDGVRDCQQRLTSAGFTPLSGTNYWECDWYKGINTGWRHEASGREVEIQFHTPRSFEIKQETHPYYRVRRSLHLADGQTRVTPELDTACRQRTAEAYRSTEPAEQCAIPPGHERLWPGHLDRSRVRGAPAAALETADHEAALERGEAPAPVPPRQADGARVSTTQRQPPPQRAPPGLPGSMRQALRHDPEGLDDWDSPARDAAGRDDREPR